MSSAQCLHDDVVEDLLWNSLDGNVLKQRGKDRSSEDALPQKGQVSTSPHPLSGRSPLRDGVEPEATLKNEAEGPFPILSVFIFAALCFDLLGDYALPVYLFAVLLGSAVVISLCIKPPRHPVLAGERWPSFYK